MTKTGDGGRGPRIVEEMVAGPGHLDIRPRLAADNVDQTLARGQYASRAEPLPRARTIGRRLRPAVLARLAVGVAVTGLAVQYLYDRYALHVSTQAVVSAPLGSLRAPIDGRVSFGDKTLDGSPVGAGDLLFNIVDDRVDDRTLAELQARVGAEERLAALFEERIAQYADLQAELATRAAIHREGSLERLEALVAEADASLGAAIARADHARLEFDRAERLSASGSATQARLEDRRAELALAEAEVAKARAALRRVGRELDAARHGVMIADGFGDASYSQQRLDEVRMRLADLNAEHEATLARRAETRQRLAAEQARLDGLARESVRASTPGIVWSLRVPDESFVNRGEVVAEFADCRRAFVEATLPEHGFAAIHPGAPVRVRLSGEDETISGSIRSVRGASALATDHARVAGVSEIARGMMSVVVDIGGAFDAETCPIGRSATVRFTHGAHDSALLSDLSEGLSALLAQVVAVGTRLTDAYLSGSARGDEK